jgi:hypothetical protein
VGQKWSSRITCHVPKRMGECEGMNLHIPKWVSTLGVRVLTDSRIFKKWLIVGVKTHWIKNLLISLKRSWNVDVLNGLARPIWVLKTQVMAKGKVRSQIVNLTPNH